MKEEIVDKKEREEIDGKEWKMKKKDESREKGKINKGMRGIGRKEVEKIGLKKKVKDLKKLEMFVRMDEEEKNEKKVYDWVIE